MINFIKKAVESVEGIKSFLFNTDYRNNFDLQNVEFPCCVLTPIMSKKYDLKNIIRESAELQLSVVDLAPYEYTGDELYDINKRCSDLALQVIANLQVKSKLDKELTFEFILPSGDELISGVMCNLQCTMKQGSCIGAPSYVEVIVQPIKREGITSNGKHIISPSSGFNAMREVEVDVQIGELTTEEKVVDITSNGEVEILPTSADAMTKVTANVQVPPPPLEEKQITITENGVTEIVPTSEYGLSRVEVTTDVPIPVIEGLKEVKITTTNQVSVHPSEGFDAIKQVDIDVDIRPIEENDVNFYDYDGTILYSYSWAEFQALKEMPLLPSHEGLICEGWNWTLEDAKQMNGWCEIGALYITDNGATRLYIEIVSDYDREMSIYWGNSGIIYWGDGAYTLASSRDTYFHTYEKKGKYCIEIMEGNFNPNVSDISIAGNVSTPYQKNLSKISKVECGANLKTNAHYAFYYSQIKTITIPKTMSLGNSILMGCQTLRHINLNETVMSNYVLRYTKCKAVFPSYIRCSFQAYNQAFIKKIQSKKMDTSDRAFEGSSVVEIHTFNNIGTAMFINCLCLQSVFFGGGAIYANALNGCKSLKIFDCTKCTTVPILNNVNAFDNTNDTFEILVPSALYDEWIATANWAEYAEQIKGV